MLVKIFEAVISGVFTLAMAVIFLISNKEEDNK